MQETFNSILDAATEIVVAAIASGGTVGFINFRGNVKRKRNSLKRQKIKQMT